MEILIALLALLVCFNFILKQTENARIPLLLVGIVCFLFVGLSWPWAIEQSRTEIMQWLADRKLMTDLTVLLTLDVFLQMLFCWEAESRSLPVSPASGWRFWSYRFLQGFPGLLLFPVLFALLVSVIFSFPGFSFPLLSWGLAVAVTAGLWLGVWGMKRLLPERGLRLELLYQMSWLTAVLRFVATINGQTTVAGVSEVDVTALGGVTLLLFGFGLLGWGWYRVRPLRLRNKKNKK